MNPLRPILRRTRGFARDQSGAAMVEFSIVVTLFFLTLFAVIDFGRLGFVHIGGETAMRLAVRTAVVRPAACPGVPERIANRGIVPTGTEAPRFGTSCKAYTYTCETIAPVSCRGNATNPTAAAVYARVAPLLPAGSAVDSLLFTYTQDKQLGYLGGPYVPVVTVELIDRTNTNGNTRMSFQFLSPFTSFTGLSVPKFSSSLPAEDLNNGDAG